MVGFNITDKVALKILIPVGACLDVPTGAIVVGKMGESIINGGLGQLTGIVGPGNSFKSTILHYLMLSAADKVFEAFPTIMMTYDTENNISLERTQALASKFKSLPPEICSGENPVWTITDKSSI